MKMFAQHRILLSTRKSSPVGRTGSERAVCSVATNNTEQSAVLLAAVRLKHFAAELPLKNAMLCTHLL
jgi:hypothetical protein